MIAVRLAASNADHEVWTRLRNVVEPEAPSTVDDLRESLRRQPEGRFWIAADGGEALGCAFVARSSVPGRAFVLPRVVPHGRRRGVGSALLAEGLAYARTLGCERSRTSVDGRDAASLAWARRRGYEEVDRQVELMRPLAADEPETQAPPGLELVPGHAAEVEELRLLVAAGVADMPVVGGLSAALVDELLDELAGALHVVVARDRGEAVGVAGLVPYGARDGALEHAFTTVLPAYRGRGLALALKRECIGWAAAAGYRELVTWTQAGNEGMQAVNERAGFVTGGFSLTLEAPL
jgi:GNAT superfamily N-acetyltransferase